MKSLVQPSFLLALLLPGIAFASNVSPPQSQALPQVMTTTGTKFVARCSDKAFAKAGNPRILAIRCAELLDSWRVEADMRVSVAKSGQYEPPAFSFVRGSRPAPPPR
ncbi:MAG: hypothetical protein ACREO7_11020 [Pseudoxanthomonas sp.]